MKPEEIQFGDWARIFMGENPPAFFIEALLRIAIIYIILMVSMRIMGKRMGSLLTRNEMIALVCLAAANGVALQSPERGILPVIIIAVVIIGFQKYIAWRAMKSTKFESLVLDDVDLLVKDGYLQLDKMEQTRLTRERLMAEFRHNGINNVGRVQRAYLEANGKFSILQYPDEKIGLSTLPNWDKDFHESLPKAPGNYACRSCGNIVKGAKPTHECDRCHLQDWEEAVIT
ncbi:hypothetical protein AAE02nite_15310 [Adhaeribacter aerolatus]|uniref:YetF C-terminal domain-containing protein n=1 Tax=Adhaeribacter aerolatus TaxID=670289 RepID=A0A512AWH3_9BACT|nr:YetF domain-containing protein [Adhaeribacter aerolatus]GEO03867.1 hypothetical protein AAE02nite_15310 [Adhaeribacter aerolatus]